MRCLNSAAVIKRSVPSGGWAGCHHYKFVKSHSGTQTPKEGQQRSRQSVPSAEKAPGSSAAASASASIRASACASCQCCGQCQYQRQRQRQRQCQCQCQLLTNFCTEKNAHLNTVFMPPQAKAKTAHKYEKTEPHRHTDAKTVRGGPGGGHGLSVRWPTFCTTHARYPVELTSVFRIKRRRVGTAPSRARNHDGGICRPRAMWRISSSESAP